MAVPSGKASRRLGEVVYRESVGWRGHVSSLVDSARQADRVVTSASGQQEAFLLRLLRTLAAIR
jgi:hypothetical protein